MLCLSELSIISQISYWAALIFSLRLSLSSRSTRTSCPPTALLLSFSPGCPRFDQWPPNTPPMNQHLMASEIHLYYSMKKLCRASIQIWAKIIKVILISVGFDISVCLSFLSCSQSFSYAQVYNWEGLSHWSLISRTITPTPRLHLLSLYILMLPKDWQIGIQFLGALGKRSDRIWSQMHTRHVCLSISTSVSLFCTR